MVKFEAFGGNFPGLEMADPTWHDPRGKKLSDLD